jgi:glycosyltransferase involved in cell wall biosynthesis
VPEIVDHGVTGYVVDSIDDAVSAVHKIARLEREEVRIRFEERFSAARMAHDYVEAYRALLRQGAAKAA